MSTVDVTLELRIFEQQVLVKVLPLDGALVLGRQYAGEDGPFSVRVEGPNDEVRVVIAGIQEFDVSRRHVRVEPLGPGLVRLANLSQKQPVVLLDRKDMLATSRAIDLPTPVRFQLGNRILVVENAEPVLGELKSLNSLTLAPGQFRPLSSRLTSAILAALPETEVEQLLHGLQGVLDLMQCAAGSGDFFQRSAQSVVDLLDLHRVQVILRDGTAWNVAAFHSVDPQDRAEDTPPSKYVLDRVVDERRTFWRVHLPSQSRTTSLAGIESVVAAPILHRNGQVAGILYGERQQTANPQPVTRLEALLMELLACTLAAGMARLEQEQEALATRVRFEQFFTQDLARQLLAQPELLKGQDADISTLFIDLIGFSRISERIGPQQSAEWITDVMNVVSDEVLEKQGVLVDFVGDGVLAMWGAPQRRSDHAELASRAALAVQATEAALTARWQPILQAPVRFHMGLNSGMARVGNVGSRQKFKYGPLGNTVNLASRIQGAARHFKTHLLTAGSTAERLPADIRRRRLGRVRVKDIAEPVQLYELAGADRPDWDKLKEGYENALTEFEQGRFRACTRILGSLLVEFPHDGPSLVLMSRAVNALVEEADDFDSVWTLPTK